MLWRPSRGDASGLAAAPLTLGPEISHVCGEDDGPRCRWWWGEFPRHLEILAPRKWLLPRLFQKNSTSAVVTSNPHRLSGWRLSFHFLLLLLGSLLSVAAAASLRHAVGQSELFMMKF